MIQLSTRAPENRQPASNNRIKRKRAARVTAAARITCALLCACMIALLSGCSEKGNDWITAPTAAGDSVPQQSGMLGGQGQPVEGEYPAPGFVTGRYMLTSETVNSQNYTDANGTTVYSYSMLTRYVYMLDITVGENIACTYTFRNIYGSSTVDGQSSVEIDTDNASLRNETNSTYYDIIGASFTVTADKDASLTGISGVDAIIAQHPGADALLSEELLYNMAGDLFYSIPRTFGGDVSWQVEQYGINNTYRVERMSDGMFGISLSGGDMGIPDPVTDAEGYTTTYTDVDNISGSLWMDRADRAVQELKTTQRSHGTISDIDNNGVYFTLLSTTSSVIVKA